MNLVSLAMNFITPAIVNRIASALGVDSKIVQMAVSAALPTILGSIVGKASKPEGLSQLSTMLGQQDAGLLSNFSSMIGGTDQSKLVTSGTTMLGSLLGNTSVGALTGAVGKFTGLGEAPAKSLIGMIAPVAMGTLAHQQKSNNLDAAGLGKLLASQKDNITAAMPAGFGDLLKGTGILDGFALPSASAAAGKVASAASSAASTATNAATTAAKAAASVPAPKPAGLPSWLTWGALLAALLAGWYLLGPGARPTTTAVPAIMHNNVNVAGEAANVYAALRDSISGMKDQASAQSTLPKLQDAAKRLTALQTTATQMPASTRGDLAKLIAGYLPQIRALAQTAMNAAGVSGVAKTVVDQILNQMEALAKG